MFVPSNLWVSAAKAKQIKLTGLKEWEKKGKGKIGSYLSVVFEGRGKKQVWQFLQMVRNYL